VQKNYKARALRCQKIKPTRAEAMAPAMVEAFQAGDLTWLALV